MVLVLQGTFPLYIYNLFWEGYPILYPLSPPSSILSYLLYTLPPYIYILQGVVFSLSPYISLLIVPYPTLYYTLSSLSPPYIYIYICRDPGGRGTKYERDRMPQLNGYTYLSQTTWTIILLFIFYYSMKAYLLPLLFENSKIKTYLLSASSSTSFSPSIKASHILSSYNNLFQS